MKLYSLLNQDAKAWWYHKQLWAQGQGEEARQRERQSIVSHVRDLRRARECGFLSVGRGGWTLYQFYKGGRSSLQGYGGMNSCLVQAAVLVGVPTINTLTIPDNLITRVTAFPMINMRREDEPPWGPLSYAPFGPVAALYKALGAEIINFDVPAVDTELFTGATKAESAAWHSWCTGDELGLFRAMEEMRVDKRDRG